MNVGDKVICKKSFKSNYASKLFIKDNVYYINVISDLDKSVYISKHDYHNNLGHWFNTIQNIEDAWILDFDECFYSDKELRKMKLEKLF